jgi:hypothetical protein
MQKEIFKRAWPLALFIAMLSLASIPYVTTDKLVQMNFANWAYVFTNSPTNFTVFLANNLSNANTGLAFLQQGNNIQIKANIGNLILSSDGGATTMGDDDVFGVNFHANHFFNLSDQQTNLASSQASITFTIPSGYTSFEVEGNVSSTTGSGAPYVKMVFNGDTAAHYDENYMYTIGTNAPATTDQVAVSFLTLVYIQGNVSVYTTSPFMVRVFNYSSTSLYKQVIGGSALVFPAGPPSFSQYNAIVGGWRSTAAITTVTFTLSSGSFVSGDVITIRMLN